MKVLGTKTVESSIENSVKIPNRTSVCTFAFNSSQVSVWKSVLDLVWNSVIFLVSVRVSVKNFVQSSAKEFTNENA